VLDYSSIQLGPLYTLSLSLLQTQSVCLPNTNYLLQQTLKKKELNVLMLNKWRLHISLFEIELKIHKKEDIICIVYINMNEILRLQKYKKKLTFWFCDEYTMKAN